LTGWLTAAIMAATIYFGAMVFPLPLAIVLAIVMRTLVTGALHEDGLADFIDCFGGGSGNRERVLEIMKDSHIGTYGVLGLIAYEALLFWALYSLGNAEMAAFAVIAADPYSKMLSGQLIQMMPYARRAEDAKNKVVYRKVPIVSSILLAVQGLLPGLIVLLFTPLGTLPHWGLIIFVPCLVMYFLYLLIWRTLRGYTGDCCGAVCLLVELSVYLCLLL
jgi:adenosylcobinamide-GDP ribazoletransferase